MKIALFGYGKMGKTIEQIALKRSHKITLKVDDNSDTYSINDVDVAIEFSTPQSAFANISHCLKNGIPVIVGTTGWLDKLDKAEILCNQNNTGFIYASNFSLGVNLFFELNNYLTKIISPTNQYFAEIEEIHHTEKLDTPSGTAITIADSIVANSAYTSWSLKDPKTKTQKTEILPIHSIRKGQVLGTHIVTHKNEIDTLKIEHIAHTRDGFALGAVIAAEWLIGKIGVFTMKDVLNL